MGNNIVRKLLTLFVAFFMIFSSVLSANTVFAEDGEENNDNSNVSWEIVDNDVESALENLKTFESENDEAAKLTGNVRVSIVLEKDSALSAGYQAKGAALDPSAVSYRESLRKDQDNIAAEISKNVLGGEKLDVVWNLTLAANIISAYVPAEKIGEIKDIEGVKDVVIENQYLPEEDTVVADPNMTTATEMTNVQGAWSSGYTGAGQLIAIVDTGLDIEHQSFDSYAFDFSIEQLERKTGRSFDLLEANEVRRFWNSLNASQLKDYSEETYVGSKVPFAFNYVDGSYDVTHVNDTQGEHGSHVASIAAGNKYIYVEEGEDASFKSAKNYVHTVGNAPDAQLLVMKVFGKGGGAYDSDYFSAIEDALVLGADAVNLSLGSSVAGFTYSSTYNDLIESLKETNLLWANSAGNNSSWGQNTWLGNLYAEDSSFATGGSPATFVAPLSVASVDNYGFTGAKMTIGEDDIYYTETLEKNQPMRTIGGDHSYILIDSVGSAEEFAELASVLEGKIAVCKRGTLSFYEKAENAVANGAIATIIFNNQPGTINMALSDYTKTQPCVSITQADGYLMMELAEEKETANGLVYYEGSIHIDDDITTKRADDDYYTMSSFSSFGVPGDLSLKPEITAPGGNIYAVFGYNRKSTGGFGGGHDQYENMSGTSMASPQIAGITAVMAEYVKENGVDEAAAKFGVTRRALIQSLLMSTATPMLDEDTDYYYSVMSQGAGLANVEEAMNSTVFVLMDSTAVNGEVRKDISYYANDGKVKAELGDDPDRSGKYTVSFTLNNLTKVDRYFNLEPEFFTQSYGADESFVYLTTKTEPINAAVEWYINGEKFVDEVDFDFNGDGVYDDQDAQALLDYVTGVAESIEDEDFADLDEDGDIDTYDAYLALKLANRADTVVPAEGSVLITAEIEVDLENYDDNGAYVEGYLFAEELASKDGALGVRHSIPVLGYYGSWSEPSMVDVGTSLAYEYELEEKAPYMYDPRALGADALDAQTFIAHSDLLNTDYYFGGNPVMTDSQYFEERNALAATSTITGTQYSLIRNSVAAKFEITDEDDNVLASKEELGMKYAAYYYPTDGAWKNLTNSSSFGFDASQFEEGQKLKVKFYLAPEYYVNYETGAVDWTEVEPVWVLPFTMDSTKPGVDAIFATRMVSEEEVENDEGQTETVTTNQILITASLKDNGYIAAVVVRDENDNVIQVWGSRDDEKSGKTDRQDYVAVLDDAANIPDHIYFQIWDYAANLTTVKVNLNKEELDDQVTIELSDEEVNTVVGNKYPLSASVGPWGIADDSVTWTSENPEIASVDENGIVTGLQEGDAVITATANADPSVSASCLFHFITIVRDLNGVVWDENGTVWYAGFNTASLPEFEAINNMPARLASLSYAEDGVLYGATFDTDEFLSSLYTYDPASNTAELIGDSSIGYMDLAPAPSLGGDKLLAVYGPYVVIVDRNSGDYIGVFNFANYTGNHSLVGIAYEEQYIHPNYGPTDWYFLVTDDGQLLNAGFLPIGGSISRFTPSNLGKLGYESDAEYFSSLYYDGTDLYWSRFRNSASLQDIVFVSDIYNDGSIYNVGSFAPDVWPVGGLFNENIFDMIGAEAANSHEDAVLDTEAVFETEIAPIAFTSDAAAKGGLDSIKGYDVPVIRQDSASRVEDDDDSKVVISLTADGSVESEGAVVSHNGLFNVEYDADALELEEVETNLAYTSCNGEDEGVVVFGFISENGVVDQGEVARLIFSRKNEEGTTVTVDTLESENENPEITDEIVIDAVVHVESVELDKEELTLGKGESEALVATVLPEDASDKSVVWASSDEEVATVDEDGVVTGVADGTATITVYTNDGQFSASCEVTVVTKVTGVELDKSELAMVVDDIEVLTATVSPEDATNKDVTWSSTDVAVAAVDRKGNVYAKGEGTATVKVTTLDGGFTAECVVTVTKKAVPVESVSLDKEELVMVVGDEEQLTATVLPEDATNKDVAFESSDPAVVTVDEDGVVNAVAGGEAVITVTTADGQKSASCKVTVKLAKPVLTAIYNSANGADIRFNPVEGASEYVIMRKFNGQWSDVVTVKAEDLEPAGNGLKYIDGEVKDNYGKGYIYSVRAKNGNVESDYDAKGLALYRLTAPVFTSGVSNAKGEATLSWKKVDAHGYEVQFSKDGGKHWTKAPEVTGTSTTIKGLESGVDYVFRIRCQKTNKDRGTTWSQYSKWYKVTVK